MPKVNFLVFISAFGEEIKIAMTTARAFSHLFSFPRKFCLRFHREKAKQFSFLALAADFLARKRSRKLFLKIIALTGGIGSLMTRPGIDPRPRSDWRRRIIRSEAEKLNFRIWKGIGLSRTNTSCAIDELTPLGSREWKACMMMKMFLSLQQYVACHTTAMPPPPTFKSAQDTI